MGSDQVIKETIALFIKIIIGAALLIGTSSVLAYWTYGWTNVVDELVCVGIVFFTWGITLAVAKPPDHTASSQYFLRVFSVCVTLPTAAVVCAFCEPGSTVEMVLIALLALVAPVCAMMEP